jgi:hypothetical protein
MTPAPSAFNQLLKSEMVLSKATVYWNNFYMLFEEGEPLKVGEKFVVLRYNARLHHQLSRGSKPRDVARKKQQREH